MRVHAVVRHADGLAADGAGHLLRAASTLACIRTEKCQELSATRRISFGFWARGLTFNLSRGRGRWREEDSERSGERRMTAPADEADKTLPPGQHDRLRR
jgi:hypothetical protein